MVNIPTGIYKLCFFIICSQSLYLRWSLEQVTLYVFRAGCAVFPQPALMGFPGVCLPRPSPVKVRVGDRTAARLVQVSKHSDL